MLSKATKPTVESISNVLESAQLKLIQKPVDGPFLQGASQAGMGLKNPRAERGAPARFSSGISVPSREGQKEMILAGLH